MPTWVRPTTQEDWERLFESVVAEYQDELDTLHQELIELRREKQDFQGGMANLQLALDAHRKQETRLKGQVEVLEAQGDTDRQAIEIMSELLGKRGMRKFGRKWFDISGGPGD